MSTPLLLTDQFLNYLRSEKRDSVAKLVTNDIMLLVKDDAFDGTLYIGKDNFFKAFTRLKRLIEHILSLKPQITWIIEGDHKVQMIAEALNAKKKVEKEIASIEYHIKKNKVSRIKLTGKFIPSKEMSLLLS